MVLHIGDGDDGDDYDSATLDVLHFGNDHGDDDHGDYDATWVTEET